MCATLFNMGHIHHQNEDVPQAISAWVTVYQLARPMQLTQALNALEQLGKVGAADEGAKGSVKAYPLFSIYLSEKNASKT